MNVLGYVLLSIENSIITCTCMYVRDFGAFTSFAVYFFLWVVEGFFDLCSTHFHYIIHWTYMLERYGKKRFMYFHLEITLFSTIMFHLLPIWQRTFLFSLLMTKENYSDARHFIVFSTLSEKFFSYLGSYVLVGNGVFLWFSADKWTLKAETLAGVT